MPRVALTQEQKQRYAEERLRGRLAEGLGAYKTRQKYTNQQLAQKLGLGRKTVSLILDAETVKLDTDQMLRIMSAAGMLSA